VRNSRAILRRRRAVLPHAATQSEFLSFIPKGWGAYPETGIRTVIDKMITGLAAAAMIVAVATPMSASAQQKKLRVAIPKQTCEMVTANTQNWGKQKVQVCGPIGAARGQASSEQQQQQNK
jgi:hypothetical protein